MSDWRDKILHQDIQLVVRGPVLAPTREEKDAQRAMIEKFGDPSELPEIPYETPKPTLPKLSDEISERRRLREEVAEGEARIAELQRQLQ